jgi:hypothetical protein
MDNSHVARIPALRKDGEVDNNVPLATGPNAQIDRKRSRLSPDEKILAARHCDVDGALFTSKERGIYDVAKDSEARRNVMNNVRIGQFIEGYAEKLAQRYSRRLLPLKLADILIAVLIHLSLDRSFIWSPD